MKIKKGRNIIIPPKIEVQTGEQTAQFINGQVFNTYKYHKFLKIKVNFSK